MGSISTEQNVLDFRNMSNLALPSSILLYDWFLIILAALRGGIAIINTFLRLHFAHERLLHVGYISLAFFAYANAGATHT